MSTAEHVSSGHESERLERSIPARPQKPAPLHSEIDRAIEAFVGGYCFTRSFTHPYVAGRVGPVWVLRDAPRKRPNYRNEEWIATGVAPEEVDSIARKHTRGRFAICAISAVGESDEPLRAGFRALGYRLGRTEPLMNHRLRRIQRFAPAVAIERVTTEAMANRLAKAARTRQILPENLGRESRQRQYVAMVDSELVGWVASIVVGDATWCTNMYVVPAFRRRGIARGMLCRMLRDDRAGGARTAVLLASHTGARLYSAVGYQQIATLLLYTPRKGQSAL